MRRWLFAMFAVALFGSMASAAPKHVWKPAKSQLEAAKKTGKPVVITNSVGMKFVLIPAGSFMMGSPPGEPHHYNEEHQHRVVISRPFYIQTTEVTQAQWRAVIGKNPSHLTNPSHFKGCDRCPVENVSWHDAQLFIRHLNAREKTNKYRLPTEAEWEYACRAGTSTAYYHGNSQAKSWIYAWEAENSKNRTHPVAQKPSNRWGLFDMHGNVAEWCSDRYAKDYYQKSPLTDPKGPASGRHRVYRGGSWGTYPHGLRSAERSDLHPSERDIEVGFRVVRMP